MLRYIAIGFAFFMGMWCANISHEYLTANVWLAAFTVIVAQK